MFEGTASPHDVENSQHGNTKLHELVPQQDLPNLLQCETIQAPRLCRCAHDPGATTSLCMELVFSRTTPCFAWGSSQKGNYPSIHGCRNPKLSYLHILISPQQLSRTISTDSVWSTMPGWAAAMASRKNWKSPCLRRPENACKINLCTPNPWGLGLSVAFTSALSHCHSRSAHETSVSSVWGCVNHGHVCTSSKSLSSKSRSCLLIWKVVRSAGCTCSNLAMVWQNLVHERILIPIMARKSACFPLRSLSLIRISAHSPKRSVSKSWTSLCCGSGRLGPWLISGGTKPSCCCSRMRLVTDPCPSHGCSIGDLLWRLMRQWWEWRRWLCNFPMVWYSFIHASHLVWPKRYRILESNPWRLNMWAPSPPLDLNDMPQAKQPYVPRHWGPCSWVLLGSGGNSTWPWLCITSPKQSDVLASQPIDCVAAR